MRNGRSRRRSPWIPIKTMYDDEEGGEGIDQLFDPEPYREDPLVNESDLATLYEGFTPPTPIFRNQPEEPSVKITEDHVINIIGIIAIAVGVIVGLAFVEFLKRLMQ